LTSHHVGSDLADGARYLLLTSSDPIDALPHCVEVTQHRIELLVIWVERR
jgi:hypothetical protein